VISHSNTQEWQVARAYQLLTENDGQEKLTEPAFHDAEASSLPPAVSPLSSRVSNRFPPTGISYFRDSDGSYGICVVIVLSFFASVSQLP